VTRIAVIDYELCQPDKCGLPCIRFCPVNRTKPYKAIEQSAERKGKPVIYEELCIACGICVKKCPYDAIRIVNLPTELEEKLIHRYGPNEFKLYGIPSPIRGKVVGIIGRNGIGKTTAIRILAGELIPNLGNYTEKPSIEKVIEKFRGTELYNYFSKLYNKELRVIHKIQYVEVVPKYLRHGDVITILRKVDERGLLNDVVEALNMKKMLDRKVTNLSGGELQKLVIAAALLRNGDVYIFDEPTSYLDIRERLRLAQTLSELLPKNSYVLIVEHDLTILDYVSDYVVIAFGIPGVYGMFSKLYATGSGINHYLEGYLPAENMRIRNERIVFHLHSVREEAEYLEKTEIPIVEWSYIRKKLNGFRLEVSEGRAYRGEVIGIIGPNAIGKTTFIKILAGIIQPDEGYTTSPVLRVSYKPQYLSREVLNCSTVEECVKKVNSEALDPGNWLFHEVIQRLGLDRLRKKSVTTLSGGELQKLFVALALIKDADVYLLDEPSAHIDVEDQLSIARAIKRITRLRKAVTFVVEHNLLLLDYAVDRLIVFRGEPEKYGHALSPNHVAQALNEFLKDLDITFRRDPQSGRPRMNKPGSYLDRYQKSIGEYFYSKERVVEGGNNQ